MAAEVAAVSRGTMKALVYHGAATKAWEDKPRPALAEPTDAVVRVTTSTICGSNLHIPYADTSLYAVPEGANEESIVMLSDILPTSFECGVLKGNVGPGDRIAVGAHIANIGVHGKPVTLPMEKLWDRNIHRFPLGEIDKAYGVFENAARVRALKVILKGAQ